MSSPVGADLQRRGSTLERHGLPEGHRPCEEVTLPKVAAPARELERFTLGLDTLRNRGQTKTFCRTQHRLYDFAAVTLGPEPGDE